MKKIGSGSFRIVYEYPSDPDNLAVKVPRANMSRYGRAMNQEEIKSFQLFPELFPKTYNNDLDQLVVDRADVITTPQALMQALPEIAKLEPHREKGSIWEMFRSLINIARHKDTPDSIERNFGVPAKLAKSIVKKSSFLLNLADAIDKLNIDVKDIDKGNIGLSRRTQKFVLIDASTMQGFSG